MAINKLLQSIFEKIDNGEPLTHSERRTYILYAVTEHGGKMLGIPSISTSCLLNNYCRVRRCNPKFVCYMCYAAAQMFYKSGLAKKLERNTKFFSTYELVEEDIPFINSISGLFRFESFGDVVNELQAKNYYLIASVNNHLKCGIWTKNPMLFLHLEKPSNVSFVYSIAEINYTLTPVEQITLKNRYPFIDKFFIVYKSDFAERNAVAINCGSACCHECGICYDPSNGVDVIREVLKKGSKHYD